MWRMFYATATACWLVVCCHSALADSPPSAGLEAGPFPMELKRESTPREASSLLTSRAPSPSQLDTFFQTTMATYHISGIAACVVVGDQIAWTGAYGYRDAAQTAPVTDNTLFLLASISKTFTATAAMQLHENGLLDLDTDINTYLPFTVENPAFPDSAITMRMLLSHTSSIDRKDNTWYVAPYTVVGGDCPIPLGDFLSDYLDPGGSRYDVTNYLTMWPPGKYRRYSNYGFALVGYIVEQLSGMPFEQYFQDSVFAPLGMTECSWFLANLDTSHIAMPLYYSSGSYFAYGHEGVAIYPAAQLRMSSVPLARQLMAFLRHGVTETSRILDSATVALMWTNHYPEVPTDPLSYAGDYGLGWYRMTINDSVQLWGHTGGMHGASTLMFGNPDDQTGFLILTNAGTNETANNLMGSELLAFSADYDHDGIVAGLDLCPDDSLNDPDNDSVCALIDNCDNTANPNQADANADGIGDACCCLGATGNVNIAGIVDLADLSALVSYLTGGGYLLPCPNEANINSAGIVDLTDLSALVSYLTGGGYTLPDCL